MTTHRPAAETATSTAASTTTTDSSAAATALRPGVLGTSSIAFIVISAAAPLTVMAGVAPLALLIGGPGAPAAYLIAGLVLLLFASGFTAMSAVVPSGGAFYSYITLGLGRPAGFASALLALVSYNALQIGVYGLLGVAGTTAVTTLTGAQVPWWVISLTGLVLVHLLGRSGVDVGAKVLAVLLTLESAILVVVCIGIFAAGAVQFGQPGSFTPTAVFAPGMAAVLALAFVAFTGFESTAIYRAEARDPERTIPRATIVSVGFLAAFYAFVVWTVGHAYGNQGPEYLAQHLNDLFAVAATEYVGAWAADVLVILLVSSVFASLLAFHNACNRYARSLAVEGVLPRALARTHPRYKSPATAGLAQTVLALVVVGGFALAGADPYRQLLLWVNTPGGIGLLLLQALACAAVLRFFWKNRRGYSTLRVIVAPALGLVLLVVAIVLTIGQIDLLTSAGPAVNTVLVGLVFAVVVLGLVLSPVLARRLPQAWARLGTGRGEEGAA
ncbi:amino acid/polyamine/organocation transporter, APC superfamily [Quadrisphaera granulorum]|uniref:Amino acid/polyamine/organocation transporter (APC superfamily) n=1 Tax=Quadrisphaera granulorum TaxID=317664 RepID=A0A315ZY68_9ACTN|nr:APC family permease [Quadrisphaera granulorum]PWJ50243.1 amino acid/polyamine/organocation transporter (APC superfamily) [Quadrisphaera granulorum]SZE98009.1 amino acid/polyamine/organocation transporter, APC superfamily [Quadrisphaera granulorum]